MGWLTGWSKRKEIVLTGGASGAQVSFQLDIAVAHAAAMQSDFSDIRFTQADGTTLVDGWLESKVDDTSADVWVEFPTTPANTVESTYYMYYGKADAVSDWDGSATFLQYHGAASANFLDSLIVDPTNNYAFETKARITTDSHNIEVGLGRDITWTGDKAFIQSYNPAGHNLRYLQTLNNSSATQASEAPCFVTDQWYKGLLTFDGTTVRGYWDGNEIGSGSTTNLPDQLMGLFLSTPAGNGEQEWSFVRKYAANPATYAFGAEESAPTGGARPPRVFYGTFHGALGGAI